MKNKKIDNAKVGMLVLAAMIFLILTLYLIGKNRNLFGSTFSIKAVVTNVNGLVPGNNVRFKGIDVGTVKSIVIANDSVIYVTMTIDESMKPYIRKNAIASIGTDGLMGNKLVNINSASAPAPAIEQHDIIQSKKPVETDEMLRTLNTTNTNIERISQNLYEITVKLNSSESLWTLLSDTVMTKDLKAAVVDFRRAGANTSDMTATAKNFVARLENGNGLANRLFNDTTLSDQMSTSLKKIEHASNEAAAIMKDLKTVVDEMKKGDGTAGLVLKDTLLRQSLFKSATNIEQGTDRFNENMEAMRSNFLFRGYFRKLEKEEKKSTQAKKD
jgi:phospholipid/cholesterol/gamma-HCH transport system substrate-binding protein